MFFSEEKNQKTFMFPSLPSYQAMAGKHPLARRQSFLLLFSKKKFSLPFLRGSAASPRAAHRRWKMRILPRETEADRPNDWPCRSAPRWTSSTLRASLFDRMGNHASIVTKFIRMRIVHRVNTSIAAFIMVSIFVAQATAQTVKASPGSGHPTQAVTVSGTGFADGEAVDVYVDLTDTVLLVSSSTGTLTGSVNIPASAAPGVHYITAIGRKSGDAGQVSFTVTTPWAEEGYGAAHLVNNPYENTINASNAGALGALWASSANTAGGTPAVSGGVAYVGAYPGVAAISTSTGATKWTAETGLYFYGSPVVSGGYIYVGGPTGIVYSLAASSGAVHWSTTLGGATFSSPVLANGNLYIGCNDDKLYALNATTGTVDWSYTTGAGIDGSPAVVDGVVYIGSQDDSLYALNATTGALIWSYTTGGPIQTTPAVANGVVYFASGDAYVYAVKAAGPNAGRLLWKYQTEGAIYASPAVANGVVYIGSSDGSLYALGAHGGALIWELTTGSLVRSAAVANGVVYATSFDDTLYVANAATGAILGTAVTGANYFGNPVISDGVVYVASYQHPLYAFKLQAGTGMKQPPARSSLHPNMDLVAVR
jgi:outer membrane protein assembly factor BamB